MIRYEDLPAGNWPACGHYKLPYGWAGAYSIPNTTNFDDFFQMYSDLVDWIKENISNPYSNAHWAKFGDCIYVQVRKRKDLTLFMLRWA